MIRQWTKSEQRKLFEAYFGREPGLCPVCAREVRMMMEHHGDETILVMRCDCGNKAKVSGGSESTQNPSR